MCLGLSAVHHLVRVPGVPCVPGLPSDGFLWRRESPDHPWRPVAPSGPLRAPAASASSSPILASSSASLGGVPHRRRPIAVVRPHHLQQQEGAAEDARLAALAAEVEAGLAAEAAWVAADAQRCADAVALGEGAAEVARTAAREEQLLVPGVPRAGGS